jgi:hypothetical protein
MQKLLSMQDQAIQLNTRLLPPALTNPTNTTESTQHILEGTKVTIQRSIQYDPAKRCGIKKCCCACHDTTSIRARSWSLELPILSSFWNPCNRSSCANATSASIWLGLRLIGIPWTVSASLNILWSSQQLCLSPSLSFQRVVGHDSPGFKLLRELRKGHIRDWDEARGELQNLFDSGMASPLDIDPDGETWLEVC